MNDERSDSVPEAPVGKRPYEAPRLIEYGRAVDLTGGGTGSKEENNPKNTKLEKFP